MNYQDGLTVMLGDIVRSGHREGTVTGLVVEGLYLTEAGRPAYSIKDGKVIIDFPDCGPVQFEEMDEDTFLISRS